MLNRSLKTIYPSTKDGLSIGIEDILGGINMHMSDLQDIIREMYIRAKAVIVETSDKTHDLEEKFSVWIDKFIN